MSFPRPIPRPAADDDEEEMNLSWLVTSSADKILKSVGYGLLDDGPGSSLNIEKIVYDPDFRYTKPGHTYTELIEKALRERKRLTVSELYAWIHENYPYFKENDGRWKNSVRHNLSISPQFKKEGKSKHGAYYWVLSAEYEEEMRKMNEVRKVISEAKKRQLEMRAAKRASRKKIEPATPAQTISLQRMNDPLHLNDAQGAQVSEDPMLVDAATDILRGVQRNVVVKYMDDEVSGGRVEDCSYLSAMEVVGIKEEAVVEEATMTFFGETYTVHGIEVFDCGLEDLREEEVHTTLLEDENHQLSVCSLMSLSDVSSGAISVQCSTDEGYGDELNETTTTTNL